MQLQIDSSTIGAPLAIIGIAATVAGAITAYLTNFYQSKEYKLIGLLEMSKLLDSKESRVARRKVYEAYCHYKSDGVIGIFHDPKYRESVESVRGDFNIAGTLVANHLIPEDAFLDVYWNTIIRCGKALKVSMQDRRKIRENDYYLKYFDDLQERADKYRKTKFPTEPSPEPYCEAETKDPSKGK